MKRFIAGCLIVGGLFVPQAVEARTHHSTTSHVRRTTVTHKTGGTTKPKRTCILYGLSRSGRRTCKNFA